MKKTKRKSKKHEEIFDDFDNKKEKSLTKAMDKVLKRDEELRKLKKFTLSKDFLKKF